MKFSDSKPKKTTVRRFFLKQLGSLAVLTGIPAWARDLQAEPFSKTLATVEATGRPAKIIKSDQEWRRILMPEQFRITRRKGTERAFSGKYHNFKGQGIYQCVACGLDLFSSKTKFDSGTGWPSFFAPISKHHIREVADNSFFMERTEVLCNRCDAHLGHVFKDGPPSSELRYCINSEALKFVADKSAAQ
ncbi:peptide-methionine (R)-S-oxide reductase MsrB [Thermodesulfobacteriota bacterium]